MIWAVIADIHANYTALQAVVKHFQMLGVDDILFTGDLVVYGPHPNECVEQMSSLLGDLWDQRCMMGNTDLYIVQGRRSDWLALGAKDSFDWTDKVISPDNRRQLSKSSQKPLVIEDRLTLVHGTLTDPMGEFTYMDRDEFTVKESFRALGTDIGLFGHAHRPVIYKAVPKPSPRIFPFEKEYPQYDDDGLYEVSYAGDLEQGKKLLICAGSVGQPRDGDPRASYLIIDEEKQLLQFYRIPYDVEAVQADMRKSYTSEDTGDVPESLKNLIDRLGKGA